jgi:arylsulfatase A-like enzyme
LYRANIEAVDSEIRCLLEDIGAKRDRTMVIVVGDNGTDDGSSIEDTTTVDDCNTPGHLIRPPHNPDHGKSTIYQLGIRAPMIVSGPLASPGVCEAAVGAVDLFDTIAAITGANPADPDLAGPYPCSNLRDSVSILPLIENPSGSATRPAFSQGFIPNRPTDDPASLASLTSHTRAVTDGHYKYIRRLACPSGTPPCEEFYDLWEHPEEDLDLLAGSPPPPLTQEQQAAYDSLYIYMDQIEF